MRYSRTQSLSKTYYEGEGVMDGRAVEFLDRQISLGSYLSPETLDSQ